MDAISAGGWVPAAFGGLERSRFSGAGKAPILWLVCLATYIARRELLVKRQQHSVAIWINVEVKAHTRSPRTLAFDCRNLVRDFASQFKESGVRALFP